MDSRAWLLTPIYLVSLAVVPSAAAAEVLLDLEFGGVAQRNILMTRSEFSERTVTEAGIRLLNEKVGRVNLIRLLIATEPFDIARSLGVVLDLHPDPYADAELLFRKYGFPHHPIAQILATREGALLSFRDEKGLRERVIQGKRDPTVFVVNRSSFRLVGLAPRQASSTITFFLVTDARITLAGARAVARQLISLVQFSIVNVVIRNDFWFLVGGFADYYRFADMPLFPSREERDGAPLVDCNWRDGKLSCNGINLAQPRRVPGRPGR
jgi:hypothetical protein